MVRNRLSWAIDPSFQLNPAWKISGRPRSSSMA